MYKKEAEGWFKHFDFILLDMICLQLAFWLAYGVRGLGWNPYTSSIYRNMALIIELADVIVILSFGTFKGVLKRGHYKEFLSCVHHTVLIGMAVVAYLFAIQKGEEYSRLVKENKLGYGKMFKLDFDPCVIGNKSLLDSRRKTGIGNLIRKTSLDEFPQFWNVLKGEKI